LHGTVSPHEVFSMRVPRPGVLGWLRSLAPDAARDASPDPDLLERFATGRDDSAFLALVRRHGPMVLGVCRRLLPDPDAAEDAFQATFLVLLQRGAALARRELLANWLYGVAYRIALQARRSRRGVGLRGVESLRARGPSPDEAAARQELGRTRRSGGCPRTTAGPSSSATCQGQTYTEAARQLGCPPGTVATRLARARERMRAHLGRRGLAVSAALLTSALAADQLSAAVPESLAEAAVGAACSLRAGRAGAISADVLTLSRGVSRTMLRTKLGFLAVLLLSLSAGSVYVFTSHGSPADETGTGGSKASGGKRTGEGGSRATDPGAGRTATTAGSPGNDPGTPLNLSGFTVISLTGAGKVTVKQTGREAVSVRGDKDLAQGASARVEKGTLFLLGPLGDPPVEFVVEAKDLRGLILTGSGGMEVTQVSTKQLTVLVGGTGDLTVAGKADVLQLTIFGAGNFLAGDLKTRSTTIRHTGMGKAVVNASRQLDVSILGNGTVEYMGSPQVRRSVLGLGTVTEKR
jgi:DNA-directed RNA polymerase specialized sigma24 family protein